jgi:hypothetical protein
MKKYFSFLLLLALCIGCEEKSPYNVVFVAGSVSVDGKPMDRVNVTFSPVVSGEGHAAGGVTDAAGKFKLTTAGLKIGKGAVPGKYNVLFSAENVGTLSDGTPYIIPALPQKYNDPKISGIEPVIVEKNGKNEFHFDLSTEGLEKDKSPQPSSPPPRGREKLQ